MSSEVARREAATVEGYEVWTPEALEEAIAVEKKLRDIVVSYYRSSMINGHHYYRIDTDEKKKPALSKEGALNFCSLFKVKVEPEPPVEIYHPDGHYTVRYRVHLVKIKTGEIVASGDGLCSTRESKYAYRWTYERDIPTDVDKSKLVKIERKSKAGDTYIRYKLPNPDLADQYNVVLKMSDKRATVNAVLKLPYASELFTQDLEEDIQDRVSEKRQSRGSAAVRQTSGDDNQATDNDPIPQHPTPEQIVSLADLSQSCGVDLLTFGQHMRRLLDLPDNAPALTKRFLRETMTMNQYEAAWAHYSDLLKKQVEDEVLDDERSPLEGEGLDPNPPGEGETTESSPPGDTIPAEEISQGLAR